MILAWASPFTFYPLTIVVLICFINMLSHSIGNKNNCLNIKIDKCLV